VRRGEVADGHADLVAARLGGVWLDFLARFPCRAAQEVSVPDGSTPVGEVVVVA
jgi:hypothetical protein